LSDTDGGSPACFGCPTLMVQGSMQVVSVNSREISVERLVALRRGLARARALALEDAEGVSNLLVSIEEVGAAFAGEYSSLERYRCPLNEGLDFDVPVERFGDLFGVVKWIRNTGMHAGAWARHATANAVELALILEDAIGKKIMRNNQDNACKSTWSVECFMVRDPVRAAMWQTIADIRKTMLRHSFSYLPIFISEHKSWEFVSDHALAKWMGIRLVIGERGDPEPCRTPSTMGSSATDRKSSFDLRTAGNTP
jgi:hypothetical protein